MSKTPLTDEFYANLYDKSVPDDMIEIASGKERKFCKELEENNSLMREAIKEVYELLKAVDNGAQQDIVGINWYDCRRLTLPKLEKFLK